MYRSALPLVRRLYDGLMRFGVDHSAEQASHQGLER